MSERKHQFKNLDSWGTRAVLCAQKAEFEPDNNQNFYTLTLAVFHSKTGTGRTLHVSFYESWTVNKLLKENRFEFANCWKCNSNGERVDNCWPFEFTLVMRAIEDSTNPVLNVLID